MTEMVLSAASGHGLGQLNPAALISKLKNRDLRENGTGNLGATNTMLVFGKAYGIAVMLFDVLKAYFAIKIAKALFTKYVFAGLIAGKCEELQNGEEGYLEESVESESSV